MPSPYVFVLYECLKYSQFFAFSYKFQKQPVKSIKMFEFYVKLH